MQDNIADGWEFGFEMMSWIKLIVMKTVCCILYLVRQPLVWNKMVYVGADPCVRPRDAGQYDGWLGIWL